MLTGAAFAADSEDFARGMTRALDFVFGSIWLVLGLIVLAVGLWGLRKMRKRLREVTAMKAWPRVTAVVTETDAGGSNGIESVRYRYVFEGREQHARDFVNLASELAVGDELTVMVNPAAPEESYSVRKFTRRVVGWAVLFTFVLVASAAAVGLAFWGAIDAFFFPIEYPD